MWCVETIQAQRLTALSSSRSCARDLPATVAAQRSRVGCGVAAATATAAPTAAASATAPTATTAATAVADHLGETGVNLLLGLSENSDQVTSLLRICGNGSQISMSQIIVFWGKGLHTVSGEERDGGTLSTGTTSTADSVDIVLRVVGVVIVEDMSNVANILKNGNVSKQRISGKSNVAMKGPF